MDHTACFSDYHRNGVRKKFEPKVTILGFDILYWEESDFVDHNVEVYKGVKFIPPSLKRFDGCTATVCREGKIVVYGDKDRQYEIDILLLPEFMRYMSDKIGAVVKGDGYVRDRKKRV